MNKIIIYDFDGTLTPHPLPRLEIVEKCGFVGGTRGKDYLDLCKQRMVEKNIDLYAAVYEVTFDILKNSGIKTTDDNISLGADNLEYNPGVEEYLEMLNKNNVSNYLLSSGVKVYLDRVAISKYFKEIYATTFKYKDDEAIDIDFLMSDKNKVFAIKDIIKSIGNKENDCSNIIYIGDGFTDYYAMEYVKNNGGTSIFVYNNLDSKDILLMKEKNVVDFFVKADYTSNSELNNLIKNLCNIDD